MLQFFSLYAIYFCFYEILLTSPQSSFVVSFFPIPCLMLCPERVPLLSPKMPQMVATPSINSNWLCYSEAIFMHRANGTGCSFMKWRTWIACAKIYLSILHQLWFILSCMYSILSSTHRFFHWTISNNNFFKQLSSSFPNCLWTWDQEFSLLWRYF